MTSEMPQWCALAHDALERLAEDHPPKPAGSGWRPPIQPSAKARQDVPFDIDPETRSGSLADVLLVLRLAATFGNDAAVSMMMEPGALTLLDGLSATDAERLPDILNQGFGPGASRITDDPRRISDDTVDLWIARPATPPRASDRSTVSFRPEDAFDLLRAVLVVETNDMPIAPDIRRLALVRTLAPVDRAVLLVAIDHLYAVSLSARDLLLISTET